MPELPEVETMVRDLSARLAGRTITRVQAPFQGSVRWPESFDEFRDRVEGRRIGQLSRRGKYAIVSLDSGDSLVIHRGMSGSLLLRQADAPMEGHVRVLFELDGDQQLRFNDPRKFGKVLAIAAQDGEPPPWDSMGPEPLGADFTPEYLAGVLANRKGQIKPLLLNQSIVAGLGNIYVDEALHRATIHPERRAGTLTREEIGRLHAAIVEVLGAAIRGRGTTFSGYLDIEGREGTFQNGLRVFHRQGAACPTCGAVIVKTVVGGRGTHFCPKCQVAPSCP